jgi:hypothetical protein
MVALFALRLSDLQAKSHDKKVPVLIMGNVRYRIFADYFEVYFSLIKGLAVWH